MICRIGKTQKDNSILLAEQFKYFNEILHYRNLTKTEKLWNHSDNKTLELLNLLSPSLSI